MTGKKRKLKHSYFLFVLCYCCFFQQHYSQTLRKIELPIQKGLESRVKNKALYIDDDGFIWYAIRGGVVKEYGTTRVFYKVTPKKSTDYYCYAIYKTSNEVLWVGTSVGVYSLDLKSEHSFWYQPLDTNTNIAVEFTSFKEDSKGTIWMGTKSNQLYSYSKAEKFKPYTIDSLFKASKWGVDILDIYNNDAILLLQDKKCFYFKDNKFQLLLDLSDQYNFFERTNIIAFQLNQESFQANFEGSYRFNNKNYFYHYSKTLNTMIMSVPYDHTRLRAIQKAKNNHEIAKLTAAHNNTLLFTSIQLKNGKIAYHINNEFDTNAKVLGISAFTENEVLIQNSKGVYFIRKNRMAITSFLTNSEMYGLENDISCRSIIELTDKSIVVSTTDSDIFKLNPKSKELNKLEFNKKIPIDLYGMCKQNDTIVWGYGYDKKLCRINLKNKTFTLFESPIPGPINYVINDVNLVGNKLFIGGNFGLETFDLNTNTFNKINTVAGFDLRNKPIQVLFYEKEKQTIWIGFRDNEGLLKVNLQHNKSISFNTTNTGSKKLINNSIRYIHKSKEQNIWIGTADGFQNILSDDEPDLTKKITVTNDNVTGVFESKNHLWYATFNGLKRYAKKTKVIDAFYTEDGLTDNEFNYKSTLQSSNGDIYLGGINGFIRFNPNTEINSEVPRSIFLAKFAMYDTKTKQNIEAINNLKSVQGFNLPPDNNYIALNFAVNNLYHFRQNKFVYKVKELHEKWMPMGNNGTLQLNGMASGTYTILVKGVLGNGVETNTLSYILKIDQVFYKTWWFLIILSLVVTRLFYIRLTAVKKKTDQKINLFKLEAKALRSQMNSHFVFNTLNNLQSLVIQNRKKEANKIFSEFSKLIRYTLNMSRTEYITLAEELRYIQSYVFLEKSRLDDQLLFTLVNEVVIPNKIKIPSMLFQPIIENAIIHGLKPKTSNRKLTVTFKTSNDTLIGIVEDNGIGRKNALKNKSKLHHSVGSEILNERIQLLNYKKDRKIRITYLDLDTYQEKSGTIVKLVIPIKKS